MLPPVSADAARSALASMGRGRPEDNALRALVASLLRDAREAAGDGAAGEEEYRTELLGRPDDPLACVALGESFLKAGLP